MLSGKYSENSFHSHQPHPSPSRNCGAYVLKGPEWPQQLVHQHSLPEGARSLRINHSRLRMGTKQTRSNSSLLSKHRPASHALFHAKINWQTARQEKVHEQNLKHFTSTFSIGVVLSWRAHRHVVQIVRSWDLFLLTLKVTCHWT